MRTISTIMKIEFEMIVYTNIEKKEIVNAVCCCSYMASFTDSCLLLNILS